MKLLVTYNIPREPFQNLPADWEITFPEKEEFSKTELLRILPDYDIMLMFAGEIKPLTSDEGV